MDNMLDYYKKTEEYNNQMLKNYKNLIVEYENSRQLYEKDIAKYERITTIACSKIVADNKAWVTTKWQLIGYGGQYPGETIYESDKYNLGETLLLDLSENVFSDCGCWPLPSGTTMYLKANVQSGDDSQSNIILLYDPTSSTTVYFELTGTAFETTLIYKGIL